MRTRGLDSVVRWLVVGAASASSVWIGSCSTKDDPRVFANMSWLVRCDVDGGCVETEPRRVLGYSGELDVAQQDPVTITCDAEPTDSGFNIFYTVEADDWGIRVSNMEIGETGGSVRGSSCQVRLEEGGNTYQGDCGANPPTENQPCQISEVTVMDTENGRELGMKFQCRLLAQTTNLNITREITSPTSRVTESTDCGTEASSEGCATFTIINCSGL